MKGVNAEKHLQHGDVIKLRATHANEWAEGEKGWIWARIIYSREEGYRIDIVAVPAGILSKIKVSWCEEGTWISSIDAEDEVIRLHPDEVPAKFWGYLAYRELTGDAQAI